MGLLSEVSEIVALAHPVGWSREECISLQVCLPTHHLRLRLGWGAYNLTELCVHVHVHVHVCAYVCYVAVTWIIIRTSLVLIFLSSLNSLQSTSDRTGATTFVCVRV